MSFVESLCNQHIYLVLGLTRPINFYVIINILERCLTNGIVQILNIKYDLIVITHSINAGYITFFKLTQNLYTFF